MLIIPQEVSWSLYLDFLFMCMILIFPLGFFQCTESINADVRKVTGANLETVEKVITGLPVSDHDHGTMALLFGNNGELYVTTGSNTNGGLAGELSGSGLQTESYLSTAALVFRGFYNTSTFDGDITYTAPHDGVVQSGDVEIFATGLRNPLGLGKSHHAVNQLKRNKSSTHALFRHCFCSPSQQW